MPLISAWVVKKPRKQRNCEGFRCNRLMPKGEPQIRLYGNGCSGDPCFAMYICFDCGGQADDEKIKKALEDRRAKVIPLKKEIKNG